jgi:hypothetical protein
MIIRSENKDDYTILPNRLLMDDRISDKARGLLVRLLCRPEDWTFTLDKITIPNKEGQHSIKSAIKELKDQNYIHWFVVRENGKISRSEYLIFDKPTPRANAEAMFKKFMETGGAR